MKFSPKAALAACLLVLVSCGGDPGLKAQTKTSMEGFSAIFEGISDEASAQAAVEDLRAEIVNLKSIFSQRDQLPPNERGRFEADVTTETEATAKKLAAEVARVMELPGVRETLAPALKEMTDAFAE